MKRLSQSVRCRLFERGQSMVEMALVMPLLLLILSGVLDLGRGFFCFIAIQNSAAEGALYAAINPTCAHSDDISISGVACTDPNNVDYRAKYESPDGLVDPQNMTVSVTYSNGTSDYSAVNIVEGNPITVTIGYAFKMVGPFSGVFPNGNLMFQAHATQNILDLKNR
jgi:Flp pilus assembly protein TadG